MFRTRSLIAIGATAAGLAVAAAPAAASTVPGGSTPTDPSAAPTSEPVAYTVLDPGDPATAVVLELPELGDVAVGTRLESVETASYGGELIGAGVPEGRFSVETELTESLMIEEIAAGAVTGTRLVESYDQTLDGEFAEQFADGAEDPEARLVDLPLHAVYDADGTLVEATPIDRRAVSPDQQDAIDELIADSADDQAPFAIPSEPLGVGARWTTPFGLDEGDDPIEATFEVLAIDDDQFTLGLDFGDQAAQIFDFDEGEATVDPASTIIGTVVVSAADSDDFVLEVTVEMDVSVTTVDPNLGEFTFDIEATLVQSQSSTTS